MIEEDFEYSQLTSLGSIVETVELLDLVFDYLDVRQVLTLRLLNNRFREQIDTCFMDPLVTWLLKTSHEVGGTTTQNTFGATHPTLPVALMNKEQKEKLVLRFGSRQLSLLPYDKLLHGNNFNEIRTVLARRKMSQETILNISKDILKEQYNRLIFDSRGNWSQRAMNTLYKLMHALSPWESPWHFKKLHWGILTKQSPESTLALLSNKKNCEHIESYVTIADYDISDALGLAVATGAGGHLRVLLDNIDSEDDKIEKLSAKLLSLAECYGHSKPISESIHEHFILRGRFFQNFEGITHSLNTLFKNDDAVGLETLCQIGRSLSRTVYLQWAHDAIQVRGRRILAYLLSCLHNKKNRCDYQAHADVIIAMKNDHDLAPFLSLIEESENPPALHLIATILPLNVNYGRTTPFSYISYQHLSGRTLTRLAQAGILQFWGRNQTGWDLHRLKSAWKRFLNIPGAITTMLNIDPGMLWMQGIEYQLGKSANEKNEQALKHLLAAYLTLIKKCRVNFSCIRPVLGRSWDIGITTKWLLERYYAEDTLDIHTTTLLAIRENQLEAAKLLATLSVCRTLNHYDTNGSYIISHALLNCLGSNLSASCHNLLFAAFGREIASITRGTYSSHYQRRASLRLIVQQQIQLSSPNLVECMLKYRGQWLGAQGSESMENALQIILSSGNLSTLQRYLNFLMQHEDMLRFDWFNPSVLGLTQQPTCKNRRACAQKLESNGFSHTTTYDVIFTLLGTPRTAYRYGYPEALEVSWFMIKKHWVKSHLTTWRGALIAAATFTCASVACLGLAKMLVSTSYSEVAAISIFTICSFIAMIVLMWGLAVNYSERPCEYLSDYEDAHPDRSVLPPNLTMPAYHPDWITMPLVPVLDNTSPSASFLQNAHSLSR